MLVEDFILS